MSFRSAHCVAMCLAYIICIVVCQEQSMTVYACITAMFAVAVLPPIFERPKTRRRSPKERRQWNR